MQEYASGDGEVCCKIALNMVIRRTLISGYREISLAGITEADLEPGLKAPQKWVSLITYDGTLCVNNS